MGMIWQDEVRKREMKYFYAGCMFTCAIIALVALFVVKLTGGVGACQ